MKERTQGARDITRELLEAATEIPLGDVGGVVFQDDDGNLVFEARLREDPSS